MPGLATIVTAADGCNMNELGITMVPGLAVGHAHCVTAATGVTLIIPDTPAVMAVDVRGGGPGTRETDALNPINLVTRAHGLALAGGSVFGLAAADELALLLSAAGRGLAMGAGVPPVPVVPGAILFDLGNGGDKAWGMEPPYRRLARAAFAAAGTPGSDAQGAIGAGHGARAGSRPGGIGSVSQPLPDGHVVGALVAVNSFGEVYAGAPPDGAVAMPKLAANRRFGRANTIIGAVATDAPLSRAQALRVAMMAHDGLARAVRPVHTPFDGDCLFAISTAPPGLPLADDVQLTVIATIAADLVASAVRRAVGLG
jgi:L-aminopeptidase/D-esterase-like protein